MVSRWVALCLVGILIVAASYASHTQFLMPGPLTADHNLQTKCNTCHASIPDGRFGWLHTIVASSDPKKENAACLTCHKVDGGALSPHDLARDELAKRTKRLEDKAKLTPPSLTSWVANTVLPLKHNVGGDIFCATCHKEHRGKNFDLSRMSDDRCQSCHVEQFGSFSKGHPEFQNYPHKRRTRVIFDHSTHFDKHFPEALKEKAGSQTVPNVCTDCHSTAEDTRLISVKPFKTVCSSCHLKQIVGTERASGPKGIAFLSLPGLDISTLKEKGILIGEWPSDSEAEVTSFMMMLIGLDEHRRQVVSTVAKLDLLDLSGANDRELSAVRTFVWELKALLHELTTSKTSEIANRLSQATGARVDLDLAARLVAAIPRDVLLSARREWLPNLDKEISSRPRKVSPVLKPPVVPGENGERPQRDEARPDDARTPETQLVPPLPTPASLFRRSNRSNLLPAGEASVLSSAQLNNRYRSRTQIAQAETTEHSKSWRIDPFGQLIKGGGDNSSLDDVPEAETNVSPENGDTETGNSGSTDVGSKPVVDAETWAQFGGWYRRDFAILYKPTGHADRFLRAWLEFSGTLQGRFEPTEATSVFEMLTHKDAQGQCVKCHSVDEGVGNSRVIEWGTSKLDAKSNRLTSFVHEPHFGVLDKRGCLSCHEINATAKYQSTYKQRDPQMFDSNFKPMTKAQCTTCHKENAARQGCMVCHGYHVNDVTSPIAKTKVPTK